MPDKEKVLLLFEKERAGGAHLRAAASPGAHRGRELHNQGQEEDGRVVPFDRNKITEAIWKAAQSVGGKDKALSGALAEEVTRLLNARFAGDNAPSIEDVQDTAEKVLVENGHFRTAKAYMLYRNKRAIIRTQRAALLNVPVDEVDSNLSVNALKVLERRYLLKNRDGNVIETPKQLFRRVANSVALADVFYDRNADLRRTEEEFFEMMANLDFLPNSPTLMNAGTPVGQLSACFVLPVEDSIESIFDAVKHAALIHQSGGGTGFAFSRLRPSGDVVRSTGGVRERPGLVHARVRHGHGRDQAGREEARRKHGHSARGPPGHHSVHHGEGKERRVQQLQHLDSHHRQVHEGCRGRRGLRHLQPPLEDPGRQAERAPRVQPHSLHCVTAD